MSYKVYVVDKDKKPLMPTTRFGKVRRLLKEKKAKVISSKPFVIQLLYEPKTHEVQPLHGGTDPGRENIGLSVIDDKGNIVYSAHLKTRNKDIPKLMAERKAHRQASRRGERLRRKRRAKKNDTTTDFPEGRKLPGYKDGVLMLKDIINTESKFNNRKRPKGWITPTVRQLIQTHINIIRQICSILPVVDWSIEGNKFAFMELEDNTVQGIDFQNGRLKGFKDASEYIEYLQEGKCIFCNNPIEHYHHITPKSKGGSDRPENLVGLCECCHHKVHKGEASLAEIGEKKKFAHLSVLNTAMPFILKELQNMFGEDKLSICAGYDTKNYRDLYHIGKDHHLDAACIAGLTHDIQIQTKNLTTFEIQQYRNHNRSIINHQTERTYKIKGKTIAKNRNKRFEQKGDSFRDWAHKAKKGKSRAEFRKLCAQITVQKSTRYKNDMNRLKPGTVFRYTKPKKKKTKLCAGKHILKGQITNGKYFKAQGVEGNFPVTNCEKLHFKSLLYL
mgnify:FL=1